MISTSIAPWLSVLHSVKAVGFYKAAFGAVEAYRLDIPDGTVVAKLTIDGAAFWLSEASAGHSQSGAESASPAPIRMILTVSDPDMLFARALEAGATQVYPIGEEHGWRLGRLVDPFGHHWEIGHPLNEG
jgi:PhnB protein